MLNGLNHGNTDPHEPVEIRKVRVKIFGFHERTVISREKELSYLSLLEITCNFLVGHPYRLKVSDACLRESSHDPRSYLASSLLLLVERTCQHHLKLLGRVETWVRVTSYLLLVQR